MKTIVIDADLITPRLKDAFVEYAQERGFVIDPARVRRGHDATSSSSYYAKARPSMEMVA
jgi:hypothetical protein